MYLFLLSFPLLHDFVNTLFVFVFFSCYFALPILFVILSVCCLWVCNLLHQGVMAINAKLWVSLFFSLGARRTDHFTTKWHCIDKGSIDISIKGHVWHFMKRSRIRGEYGWEVGAFLSSLEERESRCSNQSLPRGKLPLANLSADVIHSWLQGATWWLVVDQCVGWRGGWSRVPRVRW